MQKGQDARKRKAGLGIQNPSEAEGWSPGPTGKDSTYPCPWGRAGKQDMTVPRRDTERSTRLRRNAVLRAKLLRVSPGLNLRNFMNFDDHMAFRNLGALICSGRDRDTHKTQEERKGTGKQKTCKILNCSCQL